MGGTTDWEYHDVPAPGKSWDQFKLLVASGSDPKTDYSRNGNWTSFHYESEKLNADSAWGNIIWIWKDTDRLTIHVGTNADCGEILLTSNCEQAKDCDKGFNVEDSRALHKDYQDTLFKAASTLNTMLNNFKDKFAPVPPAPNTMWIDFMIDLITLGTVSAWGTFI
ncbi:uncharacterized protein CC84DRAFT_1205125 [Paraphaeosphaeria sporulosa]|uniref:Uncharacterized protein n=1 Tax=Paraphaeosphaeria sporulosa TaxID=1460663 RepID=A0A177CLJ0_9PLEO|nr:uncharacterized protein CC84DRAFT_1205125 [Paraphaeosphaeria sporulosa]OAG07720.1 hypothetical protein CC84DRAFT_1205125 [Paraphaeosphaeria sporulosa]